MVRRIGISIVLLLLVGCRDLWVTNPHPAEKSAPATAAFQDEVGPFPKIGLVTIARLGQTTPSGLADDPAIWVHPFDPSLSLVIGTDKNSLGGLHIFDLQGTQLQFVPGGRHNNTDLRYGFPLAGESVDLVAASDRNTNQIDVYAIDPATRLLRPVGSIQTSIDVYGFAMYHSPSSGRFFGIVSSNTKLQQWEFVGQSDGTVAGVLVRTFVTTSVIEGMVADEDLGFLYVAEENHGIYKYAAEPDRPTTRLATVDVIGPASPLLADLEGLTLYYRRDGLGYLIASSQGNNCFAVYRREAANAYLGTFAIANVSNTDGIDVTNLSLGADYADGLFVAQTRDTHFVMVRWQDIANGLGLAIDPTGHGVRLQVDCSAATSMTLTAAASTLDVGANAQWGVAVTDSTGGPLAGCAVGWSSSDPAVASVSAFGLVHAVAPGTATIRAEVGFASAESLLTVVAPVNHPPVVTLAALSSQTEGSTLSLSASFTDAAADQHTAVIDWGDGTFNTGTVDPVLRKVTGSHLFATAGTYTITVTVTDNQGASGQATTTLQVTNRPVVACYASFSDKGSAGGVAFANEDILAFDGAVWSLFFDGSDVGLSSQTIDAFQVIGATQVLLSFTDPATVGGMAVDDSDIVRFNATSLGSVTAGTFSMYFDASDVDLSTSDEDLDGVELLPDGRLLLSTLGAFAVPGAAGAREDLVAFRPITLGATTAGTFELYFDGSDVGLTSSSENIDAVAVDAAGRLHLSTNGSFAVPGVSGADEDVFIFTPTTTGATTAGTFSSALFFDGSLFGLTANDLAGIDRP